jgi:hypothetical protein
MNRQIKFRDRREDDGKWVHGYYVVASKVHYIFTGNTILTGGSSFGILDDDFEFFEVIPDTIGQFTGLYDATQWEDLTEEKRSRWTIDGNMPSEWKGREIYEGDIVKFVYSPKLLNENNIGVVLWFNNDHWAINVRNAAEYHIDNVVKRGKVIGNIHDNKLEDYENH